ncbi:MAG: MFS transporter [Solirubrobacterales bacterium]|nr:MFS transporter [Solirubrobacterales bacterium]MBV9716588.1 MFS transporter [Solirubrobacterales bacterium]
MRLPRELEILGLRDFRLVFGASVASLIGDGMVPVALSFAVLDLTGSATDLGIVLAARVVALVSSLLIGGVVADRVGRRAVMVAADVARFAAQAAIGVLLVSGHATIAEMVVAQLLVGAASGFFNPASSGLLPMVAGEHLQPANSLKGMAMAGGNIAGPAISGALVVATGPGSALLIDAASYAVSALLLARVKVAARLPSPRQRFVAELREGFAEVRKRTWVWAVIASAAFWNVMAAFTVLGPVVAKSSLGGPAGWAAILTAEGVGWLAGGVALLRVSPRRPLIVATAASAAAVVPTVLLAGPAPLAVIVVASLLAGVSTMLFNTLFETMLQRHIPRRALSRVSSFDWFGSLALQPVGLALMGPLAGAIGVSETLYLAAGLKLLTLAALLAVKDIRRLGPFPATTAPPATRSSR